MTYQKLTYFGSECNYYLYFAFDAEYFDTEIITRKLKIEPTSVMIKQNPIPKSTSWEYKIIAGNDSNLGTYLGQLLDIFEPKIELINNLKKAYNLDTRLQFVAYIDIDPEASTPYFGLNARAIDFLGKTGTEVDFDLYKADTIGLLKKLSNK